MKDLKRREKKTARETDQWRIVKEEEKDLGFPPLGPFLLGF